MAEEVITSSVPAEAAVVSSTPEAAVSSAVETTPPVVENPAPVEKVPEPVVEEAKPLLNPEAAEAKPVEEAKVEAPKPEAEPAPLPVYEFKLPEGTDANNAQFKSFTSKLGEFQNLSKAEQAVVQKFGQEMIDMHTAELKTALENKNKADWDWFNNRNKEWLESAKKDPEIGGSDENFKATTDAASRAISLYGGTKAQQLEIAKLFQDTGTENNAALLRFLSNITKIAAKEGSPVSSQSTPVQKQGIAQAMYGGKSS